MDSSLVFTVFTLTLITALILYGAKILEISRRILSVILSPKQADFSNILNLAEENKKMESEKTAGFGSIWNNNSWFYEEKNFTKFA